MLGHPVQTCTMYAQARPIPSSTPRALGKLVWQLLWTNRLQLSVLRFGSRSTILSYLRISSFSSTKFPLQTRRGRSVKLVDIFFTSGPQQIIIRAKMFSLRDFIVNVRRKNSETATVRLGESPGGCKMISKLMRFTVRG